MKKEKLGKYISLYNGINPTRAEKQYDYKNIEYYSNEAFKNDLRQENTGAIIKGLDNIPSEVVLDEGDVVINNSLKLATIIGKNNVGKVISINFTKVVFDNKRLDKQYFIYLFNENQQIKKQKERETQGNGLVSKMTTGALKELVIPIIDFKEQKKIGQAYIESIKLKSKLEKYANLLEQATKIILEENLREK